MDASRFDALVQRVAAGTSRRRLISGLLGGTALLGSSGLVDAKRGKGKGKGHGKSKNNGGGNGHGKGKGRTKVFICHKGQVLEVAQPALKGHLKHGDTQCEAPACHTGDPAETCDQETGACTFEALLPEGTECTTAEGAAGTCDAAGVCVATPVCGDAGDACELTADCCDGFTCETGTCTAI